jgi:hypothetical protein
MRDIDLSRYKVVHSGRVLNALSLDFLDYGDNFPEEIEKAINIKPKFIGVLVINEDGNIELIHDEAWCFQFIPNIDGRRGA